MTVSRPVSAPGKAFLIGEYGVLEDVPAFVTTVSSRATAFTVTESDDRTPFLSPVVRYSLRIAREYLAARSLQSNVTPYTDSGSFLSNGRKLGMGSSAAVAASVVGHQLAAAGLDLGDGQIRTDLFNLAREAHSESQGGGSGADVAASVFGGTIRFQQGKATRAELPQWLKLGLVNAGEPASTMSLVGTVRAAAQSNPAGYKAGIALIREGALEFEQALALARDLTAEPRPIFEKIKTAVEHHNRGLELLSSLSGAPILTPTIKIIVDEARRAGLAAKPSGAGGGDMVVVFAAKNGDIDRFAVSLKRNHGIESLTTVTLNVPGTQVEERTPVTSRLSGFHGLSIQQRRERLTEATGISPKRFAELDQGGLALGEADHMIENVVGSLTLPLGVATNFRIDGQDVIVPMCVEEASVVAAASNAAKMVRAGGGFWTHAEPPWMISQIQLVAESPMDASAAVLAIEAQRAQILELADTAHPRLIARGGGARELEVRVLDHTNIVVHVLVDCRDAMGANLLNTVAERVAPKLESLTGWRSCLRILSNLADRRITTVRATVPAAALGGRGWNGAQVVDLIASASNFASLDPYRAATHNKGIMNGVDAVVLATGNDWRAQEAAAHAFASREGAYRPLATWAKNNAGDLVGQMVMPTAVGVVGGMTRVHRSSKLAIELMGSPSATRLGQVIAAVGLASNLAALRALATDGIQRGHMSLHARSVAFGAGAIGSEVDALAQKLIHVGEIKAERAVELLRELRE